jgi:putative transposase
MDRDENAAINILRLGLQSMPKARSPALQAGSSHID